MALEYEEILTGYDAEGEMTYRKMWGISSYGGPYAANQEELGRHRAKMFTEAVREYGIGRLLSDRPLVTKWGLTTSKESEERDVTRELNSTDGAFDFVRYSHQDDLMQRRLQDAQGRIADLEHQIARVQQVVGEW